MQKPQSKRRLHGVTRSNAFTSVNLDAFTSITSVVKLTRRRFFTAIVIALHCSLFTVHCSLAQGISDENLHQLNLKQDTLKRLGDSLVLSSNANVRLQSSQTFIRVLIRALKVDGSYNYPFDSLKRIVVLNAPDKKFRIFNWGTMLSDGSYRYYGTIQMNDRKKLLMYPLVDYSDKIKNTDTVTSNEKWFGALYYKIIQKKKYYYLFGWDGNTAESNKKLVDVLWFDGKKKPRFGAPQFVYDSKNEKKRTLKRLMLEYREDAGITLNYDDNEKMIIYDHLIPPNDKAKGMYEFYIPDGSYEAFKYKSGKWKHVDNLWTSTQETPFPKPLDFDKENVAKPRGKK
jgi:hypothetical protein